MMPSKKQRRRTTQTSVAEFDTPKSMLVTKSGAAGKIKQAEHIHQSNPRTVISKKGNSTVVESPSLVQYSRNTAHIKKLSPMLLSPVGEGEAEVIATPEGGIGGEETQQCEPAGTPDGSEWTPQTRPQRVRIRPDNAVIGQRLRSD